MLDIIYQDEHLIAVNKPAGWLVHRSWLDRHETVFVMQTLRDQIGQHVFPVHRLDRPTSGVLLMALSSDVARALSQSFEQHKTEKIYHAVVRGYVEEALVIDSPLVEEQDKIADKFATQPPQIKECVTHCQPLATVEKDVAIGRYSTARFSLLELRPETGRKHQLRRHMSHIRHPIIGDTAHGDLRQNRGVVNHFQSHRLMLHASHLNLIHPITLQPLNLTAKWDLPWQHLINQFGWRGLRSELEQYGEDLAHHF